MKPCALFTSVGGTMSADLLTHLRADTILKPRLVGVDASMTATGRSYVDAFHQVPFGDAPEYADQVLDIVRREGVNVIVPGSDQEAFALADRSDALTAAGTVLLTSPASVLALIRDKEATYATLERAGITVPTRCIARTVSEVQTALTQFGYPGEAIVVKPIAARGGRGLRVLLGKSRHIPSWIGGGARESRLETAPDERAISLWLADGALMVMPVLTDPAYDVDVLAVRGEARQLVVRQRRNPAGIPFTGNTIVPDECISDFCEKATKAIGLDGLHDIDLMTDVSGNPALLEINPRPSGSVVAAHAAGFPIVSAAIAAALHIDYPMNSVVRAVEVAMIPRAVATPVSGVVT